MFFLSNNLFFFLKKNIYYIIINWKLYSIRDFNRQPRAAHEFYIKMVNKSKSQYKTCRVSFGAKTYVSI
jgi:hypothetical protein